MREGSLDAPTRHPIAWQDPDFYDAAKIEAELRRVFDICHGCRRCFNLCDSFPRLFDLIDESPTGELDGVPSAEFGDGRRGLHALRHVLHDEVPLRAAARVRPRLPASDAALPRGRASGRASVAWPTASSRETDRNGKLAGRSRRSPTGPARRDNKLTRPLHGRRSRASTATPRCRNSMRQTFDSAGSAAARRPDERAGFRPQGGALRHLLRQLQQPARSASRRARCWRKTASRPRSSIPAAAACRSWSRASSPHVAGQARKRSRAALQALDRRGLRRDRAGAVLRADAEIRMAADPAGRSQDVKRCPTRPSMSANTSSISPRRRAWRPGCSARARRRHAASSPAMRGRRIWAQKAAEMLRLLPDADVDGDRALLRPWRLAGASRRRTSPSALKVGRPVARQAAETTRRFVTSECPLAGVHIAQGIDRLERRAAAAPPVTPSDPALGPRLRAVTGVSGGPPMREQARDHPRRHPADGRVCHGCAREHREARRRAEARPPGRGRPVRHLLFRELRHDVAANAGDALHREGRRGADRGRARGLQPADPARARN